MRLLDQKLKALAGIVFSVLLVCALVTIKIHAVAANGIAIVEVPRAVKPPRIEGTLNDSACQRLAVFKDFQTLHPEAGKAPPGPTEICSTYDHENLSVGVQTFDSEPTKIAARARQPDVRQSFAENLNGKLNVKVDAYVQQEMAKYKIPGLTVAIIKNGKILRLKGYGVASIEFDVPANENTIYQLFSVSKIFAGVAAMKLIEDGKLSLHTPVTDIVENLPSDWKAIRIRHLLTHTSGLQEVFANPRFACLPEDEKRGVTAGGEIRYIAEMPLEFQPGEKFSYHQSGYRLLGMIVEKLTKKSYASFLQERVFAPLDMTSTQFGGTEAAVIKRRSSTSYSRESGEIRGWLYPFSVRDYPAAGLNSSAPDLAKFLLALDSGKVLKPESLQVLWSPARLNDGTEKGYGIGWTVGNHKGHKVVGHEGGGAIWVAHFPDEHLSVVVLCNLNGARADEIQYGIADLYLGQ